MKHSRQGQKVVAVIGGRRVRATLLREAEEAGRLLARAGALVVTGGLSGVMEAACRGVREGGGLAVGILPQDHKGKANPYVDVAVATGMGFARNAVIARTADAVLAVGGQYGTLSEIAFALQLGKPVVGIGTWSIEGIVPASDAREAVHMLLQALA
ncbi:MAG: TIGR00725 family protein [Nitrospirota bacterium]